MSNPLISIAMATYNGEKYLREQLDSIYNQTYSNIEVLVCDDCSNDNTTSILKEYKDNFGLKYFVNKVNLGYVKNFERAISLCSGEFIALSDQDDIFLPRKIETLVNEIKDYDVIHSDAYLINDIGNIFSKSFSEYSKKIIKPKSEIDLILNGCVTGCTCMMKSSFAKEITPFPDNLYVHDKWIGFVAFKNSSLKYIDKSLIKYRQHSLNSIGAADINNYSLFEKIIKILLKREKHTKTLSKSILNQLNFIKIIIDKYSENLDSLYKINLLKEYYYNIYNCKKQIKTILIYVYMFKYFEKNKNFKYKFGNFINNIRVIVLKIGCNR